jgi:uncharacterized membrane protein
MNTLIAPENVWPVWALIVVGTAVCIYLEQTRRWAAKLSGPVLALLVGMLLSNLKIMPAGGTAYDVVEDYLVPLAIPLLLFRANVARILRETGPMLLAFHIASVGTVVGAFLAALIFRGSFPQVPEVAGIMTGSYVGGAVNFVAIKDSYGINENLTNPLLVADNFIMAGMFATLLVMAGSQFFRRHYPHPHSLQGDQEDVAALAARHWRPKEISLLDIATALAIAFAVASSSTLISGALKAQIESRIVQSVITNRYVWITFLTVAATTVLHRRMERIQGAEDIGMYLLYLFFFVIGLRADLVEVVKNVPVLFAFCLVIALTNLTFTLAVGKVLRLNLEELLLSVNATLGGAPSAAAMAISRGWSSLVLPGLLAGIWGYVIGTFVGIVVAEALRRMIGS